jgi:hypothetical protein
MPKDRGPQTDVIDVALTVGVQKYAPYCALHKRGVIASFEGHGEFTPPDQFLGPARTGRRCEGHVGRVEEVMSMLRVNVWCIDSGSSSNEFI